MPATLRALEVASGGDEIGELLELVRAARGQKLERRVLAATLNVLAAWLSEQSRLLTETEEDERASTVLTETEVDEWASNVRLLRATPRRARTPILTCREREVAGRIARGLSNRQIAEELVIATCTTERHVANILNKLGMRSRAQVAAWVATERLAALRAPALI